MDESTVSAQIRDLIEILKGSGSSLSGEEREKLAATIAESRAHHGTLKAGINSLQQDLDELRLFAVYMAYDNQCMKRENGYLRGDRTDQSGQPGQSDQSDQYGPSAFDPFNPDPASDDPEEL